MRRSLVIAASIIAMATLESSPALAHDRPSGTKAAKRGSIELRCRPQAALPEAGRAASVLCRWSATRRDGAFRYELFRKVLGSEGRPAVVFTGADADREFKDAGVAEGKRYAYKVRVLDENGKPAARSRVVVVRCCDRRPESTEKRGARPGENPEPGSRPKPGEGRKPVPDQRPAPESSRLALQCRATPDSGTGAVACHWSGLPADKVAGYRLYRRAASGTPVVIATFHGGDTTRFIDKDIARATTYWYAVQAKSVDGWGARSNVVEVLCCP